MPMILPPPATWHATGLPALGGLPFVGLLGQVSLQVVLGWLSVPVLLALGGGAMRVWDRIQKSKGDTIDQLYRIIGDKDKEIVGLKEDLKAKDEVIAKRDLQRDKMADRISRSQNVMTSLQAQLDIARAANEALARHVDPFSLSELIFPSGYLIVDEGGTIVDAGPNIRAILHFYDKELEGRNVRNLIPEEFREKHAVFMAAARDEKVPLDPYNLMELEVMSKEGTRVPVHVRVDRWRDRQTGKLHLTCNIRERMRTLGGNGNSGSQSGDSGAFLRAGDPAASTPTVEMPQVGGAGESVAKGG